MVPGRGVGFVRSDGGGRDVFVHCYVLSRVDRVPAAALCPSSIAPRPAPPGARSRFGRTGGFDRTRPITPHFGLCGDGHAERGCRPDCRCSAKESPLRGRLSQGSIMLPSVAMPVFWFWGLRNATSISGSADGGRSPKPTAPKVNSTQSKNFMSVIILQEFRTNRVGKFP